jgi:hypothetical protein
MIESVVVFLANRIMIPAGIELVCACGINSERKLSSNFGQIRQPVRFSDHDETENFKSQNGIDRGVQAACRVAPL